VRPGVTSLECSLCLSVCILITAVSCAKAAEPIKMPFELWTWLGPRNMMKNTTILSQGHAKQLQQA